MPALQDTALISDANLQGYWKLDQTEDTNTKLLLHFNGADAATSTIESSTGKAVTFAGNAQIDTAQKKFGSASCLFDGTGDYLTLLDSADWAFGTGDFTIDCQARFNSLTSATGGMAFCGQFQDTNNHWHFYYSTADSKLNFGQRVASALNITMSVSWTPSTNTWYHVALTRSGNTWRFFVDGTQVGTDITETDTVADNTGVLSVGSGRYTGFEYYFNGWIDEFRIVKGTAKWTANFTPPTAPYSFQTDDYSANGYHLITGTQPTNVTAMFNQGGDFEATNSQSIEIAGASAPFTDLISNQTWCAWIKIESLGTNGRLFGKKKNLKEIVVPTDGKVLWQHNGLSASNTQIASALSTDTWYFIVCRYDSSNVSIWVNGAKVKEQAATGTMTSYSSLPTAIGRNPDTPSDYFDGIIDDVAIFNRALTDDEVMAIYTAFKPKFIII